MLLKHPLISIFVLLGAAGGGTAAEDGDIQRALDALGSPFLEVRESALSVLARAGPDAEPALRGAYAGADYRKKALILGAFLRGRPTEALPLVYADLSCGDRGVVHAQRRVVSAVYSRPQRIVVRAVVPVLRREEYVKEQLLRCIPAPVSGSREALLMLAGEDGGRARSAAKEILARVAAVDAMRRKFRRLRSADDPKTVEGAREMLSRIWTHDVERALLAVVDVRGRDGTYDGMFHLVRGLSRDETFRPSYVLMRIIRDEPMPESGVPVRKDRPYEFLEAQKNDPLEVRGLAALCLGDVGSARDAAALAGYFMELPPLTETGLWKNPKESVAQACAMLGEDLPLRALIGEYHEIVEDRGDVLIRRSTLFSRLGMAYSKLGRLDLSRHYFRESMDFDTADALLPYNLACALTRMGHLDEALEALHEAQELGYGSERGHIDWMDRDRDLAALWETEGYKRLRASMLRSLAR